MNKNTFAYQLVCLFVGIFLVARAVYDIILPASIYVIKLGRRLQQKYPTPSQHFAIYYAQVRRTLIKIFNRQ